MDLVPYMYHETQEPGSQLCAQHCLNNLLQQPCYTEIDLAEVASRLDQAENATLAAGRQNTTSYNYDDTGFFSISVLETALQVWDLTLVRWRGEAMRAYQDHPETQAAFILNLASHWFALRRFSPPGRPTLKRWYNLNSFLAAPEWISPTYLHLVLSQAEAEGYSVFVVRRASHGDGATGEGQGWADSGIGVLPESQADLIAAELGEPAGRSGAGPTQDDSAYPTAASSGLQLGEAGPSAGSGRRRRRQEDLVSPGADAHDLFSPPLSRGSTPRPRQPSAPAVADDDIGDPLFDDDIPGHPYGALDEAHDDDAGPAARSAGGQDILPRGRAGAAYGAHQHELGYGFGGPTDFSRQSRSYDDEDEALQAALKASMADLPPDFELPQLRPLHAPARKSSATQASASEIGAGAPTKETEQAQAQAPGTPTPAGQASAAGGAMVAIAQDEDEIVDDDDDDEPAEVLSPEEIRRRRLARFE
ncbi:hypothetical protein Q5752_006948 [Cryptotrichosporon argae]